jgi:hypothetical protein
MPYKYDKSGIYIIFNLKSGKCYIGSAVYINHRLATHKNQLRNNKHFNRHLQWSWNKDGDENFIFETIEFLPKDKDLLQEKEEYYIKLFQSNNNKFGFNRRIDCNTNLGVIASKETKLKMSLAKLGKKRPEEARINITKAKFKAVYQIDYNTLEIISKFISIKEAAEKTGLCSRSISLCVKEKILTHPYNKFCWCLVKNYKKFPKNFEKWKKRKSSCG